MATLPRRYPAANGTVTGTIISFAGAGEYWDAINDVAPDGSTSYIGAQSATAFFALTGQPGDLSTMDSVSVLTTLALHLTGDDTVECYVQIFAADEVTPLTNELLCGSSAFLGSSFSTITSNLTITGSTAAATWATARVRYRWAYTQSMGNDGLEIRITAVWVDGTYTTSTTFQTGSDSGTGVDSQSPVSAQVGGMGSGGFSDSFTRAVSTEQDLAADQADAYGTWDNGIAPNGFVRRGTNDFKTANGRAYVRNDPNYPTFSAVLLIDTGDLAHSMEAVLDSQTSGVSGLVAAAEYKLNSRGPTFVAVALPPGAAPFAWWEYNASGSASGGVVTVGPTLTGGDASRFPQAGDRLRVTWEPFPTLRVTLENLTLGQSHGSAVVTGNNLIGGKMAGLARYSGTGTGSAEIAGWSEVLGTPVTRPASVDSGGATSETASYEIAVGRVTVELWEAGAFVATLLNDEPLPSGATSNFEVAFDASLLADQTGADAELRVFGGGNGFTMNIDSVAWDAQFLVPSSVDRISSDSGTASSETATPVVALVSDDAGTSIEAVGGIEVLGESNQLANGDVGTGVDAEGLAVQLESGDAGAGAEAELLAVTLVQAESAAGLDQHSLTALFAGSDTGAASDSQSTDRNFFLAEVMLAVDYESVLKPPKVMLHAGERTLVGRASFDLQ